MKKIIFGLTLLSSLLFAETIKVGVDSDYPPMYYLENGKTVGFDVDFATLLFAEMGKDIEFVNVDYHEACKALNEGKIDVAISAFGVDEDTEDCTISVSYFDTTTIYAGRKDENLHSIADLKGKKIGYDMATEMYKDAISQIEGAKAVRYKNISGMIIALKQGLIDAVVMDSIGIMPIINNNYDYLPASEKAAFKMAESMGLNKELSVISIEASDESATAVLFGKDKHADLLKAVNETITKLRSDGKIDGLLKKYSLN